MYADVVYAQSPSRMECIHSRDYAKFFLKQLHILYREHRFCDVALISQDVTLHAHKIVLIGASEYLKENLPPREQEFNLSIRSDSLGNLIDFIYTGTLCLDRSNVKQVLSAATLLRIESAVTLCEEYITNHNVGESPPTQRFSKDKGTEGRLHTPIKKEIPCSANATAQYQADDKLLETDDTALLESNEVHHDSLCGHTQSERESCEQDIDGGILTTDDSDARCNNTRVVKLHTPEENGNQLKLALRVRRKSHDPKRCSTTKDNKNIKTVPANDSQLYTTNGCKERDSNCQSLRKRRNRSSENPIVEVKQTRDKSINREAVIHRSTPVKVKTGNSRKRDIKSKRQSKENVKGNLLRFTEVAIKREVKFHCEHCKEKFRHLSSLVWHTALRHNHRSPFLVSKLHKYREISLLNRNFKQRVSNQNEPVLLRNEELSYGLSQILQNDVPDLTYFCCSMYFRSLTRFKIHRLRKHNRFNLKARTLTPRSKNFTKYTSGTKRQLLCHMKEMDEMQRIYTCTKCHRTFIHRSNLVKHLNSTHGLTVEFHSSDEKRRQKRGPWRCEDKICNFKSPTKKGLCLHMSEQHTDTRFACKDCNFKTQFLSELEKHASGCHGTCNSFVCDECQKCYSSEKQLVKHQFTSHKIHHPSLKIFKCEEDGCDFKTITKINLMKHQTKHNSEKNYSCDECGKKLKTVATLEKHIRIIHKGIKPYICEICAMSYGEESELRMHLNRHSDTKTFKCKWCDYAAFDKGNFKSHLFNRHGKKLEENMKVFSCTRCDYQTDVKYRFNDHMRVHENKRDIQCDIENCGKSFMTRKALRSHYIKVHKEKNLRCDFCGYLTADVSKLREHMRIMHTHRDFKPYKCAYCDFQCATSGNCRKHVMQKHRGLEVKVNKLVEKMPKLELPVSFNELPWSGGGNSKVNRKPKNVKSKFTKATNQVAAKASNENQSKNGKAGGKAVSASSKNELETILPLIQSVPNPSKNHFVLAANVLPLYSANDEFSLAQDTTGHAQFAQVDYHDNNQQDTLQNMQAVDMSYQSSFSQLQSPLANYELTPESPKLIIAEDSQSVLNLAQGNSVTFEECRAMLMGSGLQLTNYNTGYSKLGGDNAVNLSSVNDTNG